jgi:DNA polymerase III subunit delta
VKLAGTEAARFFAKPDPARPALLIFGADAMRVALRRQEVIAALIGPEGEGEMRLTRISGSDLRKDASLVADSMRATGFFPGLRVVFLEEATDALAPILSDALKDWRPEDARLIVTAGNLTPKSALKALFDSHKSALSAALYDDPPGREEIEATLAKAGLTGIAPPAMAELLSLARALDPGDFRQTVEKISLYKWGDQTPLTPADIAVCAPAAIEAGVDEVIHATAEGRDADVSRLMRRLEGQGVAPVTLCIGAMRHFRTLHGAAVNPESLSRAWGVPFKAKDAMARQATKWGSRKLEEALGLLVETDLTLRSSSRAPAMAVMERALLRLARLGR